MTLPQDYGLGGQDRKRAGRLLRRCPASKTDTHPRPCEYAGAPLSDPSSCWLRASVRYDALEVISLVQFQMRRTVTYVLLAELHHIRTIVLFITPKEQTVSFKVPIDRTHLDVPLFQALKPKGTLRCLVASLFGDLKIHDTIPPFFLIHRKTGAP